MKKIVQTFVGLYFLVCPLVSAAQEMWYGTPADEWMKSLPVANGRVGLMVFGGTTQERLSLNESSMWSGAPNPQQNRSFGAERLREIRQLFFDGKIDEGNQMAGKEMIGNEADFGSHVPFGDFVLTFHYGNSSAISDYRRSLSLDDAVARVSYRMGDTDYTREYFSSHPRDVILARYQASRKGAISFDLGVENLRPDAKVSIVNNSIRVTGSAAQPGRTEHGVHFLAVMQVIAKGGTIHQEGDRLMVRDADEVILLSDLRTDYRTPNYQDVCLQSIQNAAKRKFSSLYREHVADYAPLYHRVTLHLGKDKSDLATDERWKAVKQGADDPDLQALFVQYGRYLTLISSRQDSPLPIALQGFFNDNLACNMGWNSDYHLDINTEQNYWLSNVGNLAECNEPLFRYIGDMARAGAETARTFYGCGGWTAHCTSNVWGFTAPAGCTAWGLFPTGGSWMATHLWTQYEFTGDVAYLRNTAYPLLRGNARFLLDYLCEDPHSGYLVTGPSISPENSFGWKGQSFGASMMPTIDLVLTREILNDCLQCTRILNIDPEFADTLRMALDKLPPLRINKYGGLREWMEDYDDINVNHRHTSHLLCLYPFYQVTTRHTPELAEAAYQSVQRRLTAEGWEDVEWSRAWAICNYARLRRSEEAYQSQNQLIGSLSRENLFTVSPKGIAGAPWDIFVIDGNMAGAAGAIEMLVQSHAGYIEILPVLPKEWSEGSFSGLCVRGGAEVSASWEHSQITHAQLRATHDGTFTLLLPKGISKVSIGRRALTPNAEGMIQCHLKRGEVVKMY